MMDQKLNQMKFLQNIERMALKLNISGNLIEVSGQARLEI